MKTWQLNAGLTLTCVPCRLFRSAVLLLVLLVFVHANAFAQEDSERRPNILLAISDDHSYPHASAYGSDMVQTPALDRVAERGVLFNNAFVASPGCSPSRAALLTGLYPWQIEEAGTHASSFPRKHTTFTELLEDVGYFIGYTGKGWGPGNWEVSGWTHNPVGPPYNERKLDPPADGISDVDYAGNFAAFLSHRSDDQPFFFWYGAHEPHLAYENGIGRRLGKDLADAEVPDYLPDVPAVRSDLLDYAVEIEWFDANLALMLKSLEAAGELDNTIVVVTADNGHPLPRAKANVYEDGIHVPLAVQWGSDVPGGRVVDDLVSLVDLMPTFLEAAQVEYSGEYVLSGRSLLNVLKSERQGVVDKSRDAVYSARERHSSSRFNSLSYPQRAIRTADYLYLRNFKPERWPAGAPQKYEKDGSLGLMHGAYHDIDPSPSKTFLLNHRDNPAVERYFEAAVGLRPAEELYDIRLDPGNINNLASDSVYADAKRILAQKLDDYLRRTEDPRVVGDGNIFETYKRYTHLRNFPVPDWARREENPFRPDWLPPRGSDY